MTPPHPAAAQALVCPDVHPLAKALRAALRPSSWLLTGLVLSGCATVNLPSDPTATSGPSAVPPTQVSPAAAPTPVAMTPPVAPAPAPVVISADAPPVAVDPLEPSVRVDLESVRAHDDLWARVRVGFVMTDLDNDLVRKWEQWYGSRPDYVQRMTERGGRYLFHIVRELERRNMPQELALLPFIESAFNPQAMSVAKASGMWQFIPGTGRDFSLKQNIFRDDRRDVLASTQAALDYLQQLHGMFGDWHLALAAYNWGQGNVQRAITRAQRNGLSGSYEQLQMPDETRNYVPKLQAVKNIVMRPEAFSLTLIPLKNHPYFISVGIDRDIDVDRAARLAGLPLDEFKALNPQMNKPVILAAGTPQVLLPYDNANQFVRALSKHQGALASWTAWVAPRTMRPAQVAEQLGMSEATLREVNNIPPRMLVKAGSTLLVERHGQRNNDVDEAVADNAMLALTPDLPPFKRVSFRAGKKGDSVAAVARRYRVTPTQVAAWNRTSATARFKPGQAVVVLVPQGRSGTALARANAPTAKGSKAVRTASAAAATSKQRGGKGAVRTASASSGKGGSPSLARGSVARKPVSKPGPTARSRN